MSCEDAARELRRPVTEIEIAELSFVLREAGVVNGNSVLRRLAFQHGEWHGVTPAEVREVLAFVRDEFDAQPKHSPTQPESMIALRALLARLAAPVLDCLTCDGAGCEFCTCATCGGDLPCPDCGRGEMGSHGCEHPADKVGRDDPDGDTTCWECGEVLNEAGADATDAWNTRPCEDAARREGAEAARRLLCEVRVWCCRSRLGSHARLSPLQEKAAALAAVLGGDDVRTE